LPRPRSKEEEDAVPMTYFIHITAGTIALIAGYAALYTRKGDATHRRSGRIFSYAMLAMCLFGALIAIARGAAPAINIPAAVLTSYLVITGVLAFQPLSARPRWVDRTLMAVAFTTGTVAILLMFAPRSVRSNMPAFPFLMFGFVGLLGATLDWRMIRAGGLDAAKRLRRHLWRMSYALFVASMSFFIGQAKVIPQPLRIRPLLALIPLAVLVTMFYWLRRTRRQTPNPQNQKGEDMTRFAFRTLVLLFVLRASQLFAGESPFSAHNKMVYGGLQQVLLVSAEMMKEEDYAFRPAESVRTFGQVVGHVADSQYLFCSTVLGEPNPAPRVEKNQTAKADLVAALKKAAAYCETAYAAMTDVSGAEKAKLMGGEQPKLSILSMNIAHTMEHYGNMVTYMRMKGLVPPTSDPQFMREMYKKME
jgi:uncharacterized damage-inducible protein DinB